MFNLRNETDYSERKNNEIYNVIISIKAQDGSNSYRHQVK